MKASQDGSRLTSRAGASSCAGKLSVGSPLNAVYPFIRCCALEPDRAAWLLAEAMYMIRKTHLHGCSKRDVFAHYRIMA
jgi:hypothetical protein